MTTAFRYAALLAALAIAPPVPAQQPDGQSLRDRIRERIKQRGASANPHTGNSFHTLEHRGLQRKYLLHVPSNHDPSRSYPLVVAFHGGGGHAEYMADDRRYGLTGKADREGFAVVFPNGYSKLPGGRLATWNAGACCGDARDRDIDDIGFVRALVADVRRQVRIDPDRIFATGMSNGGMMSHRLACEAPDLFRAVAAVAGTDATTSCTPSRPIPVLHIHARNDTHVLFEGGVGPDAFRDATVPATMARWVERNRCNPAPQRILDKPGAYCERYSGCAGRASVQLCVTEDGGHSWPGAVSVRQGKEPASRRLDATEAIWSFFREVSEKR